MIAAIGALCAELLGEQASQRKNRPGSARARHTP
jgi:hypothetical protein